MTPKKKSMFDKLQDTVSDQKKADEKRFETADTVLLKSKGKKEPSNEPTELVRDGFVFPANEHSAIQETLTRLAKLGIQANKTEVVRAALKALSSTSDTKLKQIVQKLEPVKRGRPKVKN